MCAGATLGNFEGRVVGIGPQIGFIFPVGEGYQGYLNLKAYKDFATENRPEGYTAWVTFAISPAAPSEPRRRSLRFQWLYGGGPAEFLSRLSLVKVAELK
jgi:hypothetical protein